MTMTSNEDLLNDIPRLVMNPYFSSFHTPIRRTITVSRNPRYANNPLAHFELQKHILKEVEYGDEAVHKGRVLISEQTQSQVLQNKRNQVVTLAYKDIADGIAYRNIGKSRFNLRITSQARNPGPAWGKVGRISEIKIAQRLAEAGKFVMLNDASNFLRVGDLTVNEPSSGSIDLVEIKKGKRPKIIMAGSVLKKHLSKGKGISKQESRLYQAQRAISEQILYTGTGSVPVMEVEPADFSDKIRSLLVLFKQASRKGVASARLTEYMYACVLDLTYYREHELKVLPDYDVACPPAQPLLVHSSYDRLRAGLNGEVQRSSMPLSVFPLPAKLITRLLLGEVHLQVALDAEPLVQAFKVHGWKLMLDEDSVMNTPPLTTDDVIRHFSSDTLFPTGGLVSEGLAVIEHMSSGFVMPIFPWLCRMCSELITVEYIVSLAESVEAKIKPGERSMSYIENLSDRRRWR